MKCIQRMVTTLCILVSLSSCADQDEEIISSSACYGVDLPCTSHHLRCPEGSLITIISAQYGYKYQCGIAVECTACCWYTEGDCMVEYKSGHYQELFRNCSLQTQCSFRAPWISHTMCSYLHRNLLTSIFSFISYKCVDVYGTGSKREDGFTTQQSTHIGSLPDFRYNKQQDSVNKDPNTVTIIVTVVTVTTIVGVVFPAFLIKFGCCKRLFSAFADHRQTREDTCDVQNGNENKTSGYSVVNKTKRIQRQINRGESMRECHEDPCTGYSVITVSKHHIDDSPITVTETGDVCSSGNHENNDRILAGPVYEYLRKVDEADDCDNFDTVITPVDNSHIYSVVNKTKGNTHVFIAQ